MLIPHRIDDGKGDSVSDGHEDGAKPPGYRLMLREMAADERPREKLKLRGSAALSDGELLAIILNTGMNGTCKTVRFARTLATNHEWTRHPAAASPRPSAEHRQIPDT